MMGKSKRIAPAHLETETAKWFESVLTDYELEPHHIRLLVLAAEAWDRCNQARGLIAVEGLTIRDRFGQMRAHPAVSIERDSRIAFSRLIRELNLCAEEVPDPPRPKPLKY